MSNLKYATVQQSLRALHRTIPWVHMAQESGMSATTIKRFANNETCNPQFRTVDLLADYVGFRLAIARYEVSSVLKLRRVV